MTDPLSLAMMGDDAFWAALDEADPDTYGISCECGIYHVGRWSRNERPNNPNGKCPVCGSGAGAMETPALGHGPASVQKQADDGGEAVLACLYFGLIARDLGL